MSISLFIVDRRPVRLKRLVKYFTDQDRYIVIGSGKTLQSAQTSLKTTPFQVLVIEGDYFETLNYQEISAQFKLKNAGIVPLWEYPLDTVSAFSQALNADDFGINQVEGREALLHDTIKGVASQKVEAPLSTRKKTRRPLKYSRDTFEGIILLGASTGGVQILSQLLEKLPKTTPPVLIVQHMPEDFIVNLARRLNKMISPNIVIPQTHHPIEGGHVYLAPGGRTHMTVSKNGQQIILNEGPKSSGHRPSIDVLFESVSNTDKACKAALLTGMGVDGAKGLLALEQSGADTVAQDEESCTVFGMPKAAIALNAHCQTMPPHKIAQWMREPFRV